MSDDLDLWYPENVTLARSIERLAGDDEGYRWCEMFGMDPDINMTTHRLVAVSPEVARLIEAVGPDNLPALLRFTAKVVNGSGATYKALVRCGYSDVPPATWERLGEALGAPDA